jgi:hypothetical protein
MNNMNFTSYIYGRYTDVSLNVEQVQIDNCQFKSQEEVVLAINKTTQNAIHVSTQIIQNEKDNTFFYLPYLNILIQPIMFGVMTY